MNIFWAIIMGTVQGLTEFFPVSSSAHLTLIPWIFKIPDPGLSFDIALHAGTLFAIIFALKEDWLKMIKSIFKKEASFEKNLIMFLVITTIPGVLVGYFLESQAESNLRNPLITVITLAGFGLILYFVDKKTKEANRIEKMTTKKAALVGVAQSLAIIPGVSRSGATITGGRALGFSREAAAKYSFLAAMPIILGATIYGLRDVPISDLLSPTWLAGFFAAIISSIWAIRFLLRYLKTNNFNIFVIYRFALAALVLILYLARS